MSADKYAQFIAEQQRKLSVSGTNPVDLDEKKELSRKQKEIAKLAGDPDEIEGEDFGRLRAMKKEDVESLDESDFEKKLTKKQRARLNAAVFKASPQNPVNIEKKKRQAEKEKSDWYNSFKRPANEEVEQIDEVGDTPRGQKLLASYIGKSADSLGMHAYGAGKSDDEKEKTKNFRTALKRTKGIKRASKRLAKEEVEHISIEESAYLEEMVGKGKLPDILAHHKNNMLHHAKMCDHHNMMADKSEQVGDTTGFDHHLGMAMSHEMDHQHHKVRYDHAVGLKARSKAQKEMKAASEAMAAASKKVSDAKALKREY